MQHSPCEILGIPNGSGPDAAKAAYRKLALAKHPDVGGDPIQWMEIEQAYRALAARGDPKRIVRQVDGRMLHLARMSEQQIKSEIALARREITFQKQQLLAVGYRTEGWAPTDDRPAKMRAVHEEKIAAAEKVIEELT